MLYAHVPSTTHTELPTLVFRSPLPFLTFHKHLQTTVGADSKGILFVECKIDT